MMYLERPLGRRVRLPDPLLRTPPLSIRDTGFVQIIPQASCAAQQFVRIDKCGRHHEEVGRTREIVRGSGTNLGRFGW
jgi:hypothetical protein